MIRDLRTILDGWDFEPGKISVRKIIGRDGREKIQTRSVLGGLQLAGTGRRDGARPHGYESLLDYHQARLREHLEVYGDDEDFVLTPEECQELRHEAYLYYQRYLSRFVLEEFEAVERDTARNLRVIELCARYAASEHDRALLRPQRAYVLMMHTRARVQLALAEGEPGRALRDLDAALAELGAMSEDAEDCLSETKALRTLRAEVLANLPEGDPVRLEAELEVAVAAEDYERAAQLRDRLAVAARGTGGQLGD